MREAIKESNSMAYNMSMITFSNTDRLVITRLFGACQVQIEKKGGAKVGTKENKI